MRRNLTIKDKAIFHGAPFKEFEITPQSDGTLIINANYCNTEISISKGFFGEFHLRIIHSDPKPGKGARELSHKIIITAEVKDTADYKVIQANLADFQEVIDVDPIQSFSVKEQNL